MKKEEYIKKRDELFERWIREKGYNKEVFVKDGIQNFDNWGKSKPKILFLLKENYDNEWDPKDGITTNCNVFSKNIARWRQVITELYNNPSKDISFDNIELPESIFDIALVDIKKLKEGFSQSSYYDIKKYAQNDRDFINEQLKLINPNIIVCCYPPSWDLYGEFIIEEDHMDELYTFSNCNCKKHCNRLIIEFYHPSTRSNKREKELFDILYKLIKGGNVFKQFNWS